MRVLQDLDAIDPQLSAEVTNEFGRAMAEYQHRKRELLPVEPDALIVATVMFVTAVIQAVSLPEELQGNVSLVAQLLKSVNEQHPDFGDQLVALAPEPTRN